MERHPDDQHLVHNHLRTHGQHRLAKRHLLHSLVDQQPVLWVATGAGKSPGRATWSGTSSIEVACGPTIVGPHAFPHQRQIRNCAGTPHNRAIPKALVKRNPPANVIVRSSCGRPPGNQLPRRVLRVRFSAHPSPTPSKSSATADTSNTQHLQGAVTCAVLETVLTNVENARAAHDSGKLSDDADAAIINTVSSSLAVLQSDANAGLQDNVRDLAVNCFRERPRKYPEQHSTPTAHPSPTQCPRRRQRARRTAPRSGSWHQPVRDRAGPLLTDSVVNLMRRGVRASLVAG